MPSSKTSRNAPSPAQSAEYAHELLESLRRIAVEQRQDLLAHLLNLAALEAERLAALQRQDTLLPD